MLIRMQHILNANRFTVMGCVYCCALWLVIITQITNLPSFPRQWNAAMGELEGEESPEESSEEESSEVGVLPLIRWNREAGSSELLWQPSPTKFKCRSASAYDRCGAAFNLSRRNGIGAHLRC